MNKKTLNIVVRIAAMLLVVGITVLIVVNRDRVAEFEELGYPGIFLVALMGSATVVFPVPHLAFTFAMGSVFSPWLVGLTAGTGDVLGELTGYMAGFALEDVAGKMKLYHRFEKWMKNHGDLTLFILALIPNPLFDMASIAGGLSGFPVWRFMLATWAGKVLKATAFAWAGFYGIQWILQVTG
ncbi:MAG: VTT domain-containing protein [Anaerolineae bacterium]|nr:VTT domain-containing protein [Anaerolineae bacterium]